ncbi:MAG: DUF1376 domain-containing protein, partial [Methylocella sp.]
MNDLPAPLVPPEADLRDFAFMPLDVVRLRDSAFTAASAAEEFRSAILLWCASWHQLPAGSLPCDDMQLSLLAGFGRAVSEWSKHKAGALRHWQECSDGRLYHPVVAEKVKESWASKLRQRWRTECARIRKNNWRLKLDDPIPELDEWLSKKCPMRQIGDVTCDNMPMSRSGPRDNRSTS